MELLFILLKNKIMDYKALHKLSYGLYIVASQFEGRKAGYVANTVFQVTSSPAQLAISCHKKNETTGIILESGVFSVSVLKKELDIKIIGDFGFMSSSDIDKFASVKTSNSVSGAPIVMDESVAWFGCKVVQNLDLGSHILLVGEILDGQILSDEEPLSYAYYREKYKMFSPKNAPTYVDPEHLKVAEQKEEASTQTVEETQYEEHICIICGFKYNEEEGDPTVGIEPGTRFADLPDDYKCPICNASKDYFRKA